MYDIPPDPVGRYEKECWLMTETGWSYRQIEETPHLVLDEFAFRLSKKNEWTTKKAKMDKSKNQK